MLLNKKDGYQSSYVLIFWMQSTIFYLYNKET